MNHELGDLEYELVKQELDGDGGWSRGGGGCLVADYGFELEGDGARWWRFLPHRRKKMMDASCDLSKVSQGRRKCS